MATARKSTTTKSTATRTRRVATKRAAPAARTTHHTPRASEKDYTTRIKDYATEHPWITAAAGVGGVAVAWYARRLWLPIAAAAALDRLIPKTGDALTIEGIQRHWKSMKPSFMS